jgi:hypothetical protein
MNPDKNIRTIHVEPVIKPPTHEENLASFKEPSQEKGTWYHTTRNDIPAEDTLQPRRPNMESDHPIIALTSNPEAASKFNPRFSEFDPEEEFVSNKAIYPVHVQVKKPFDYDNPKDLDALEKHLKNNPPTEDYLDLEGDPSEGFKWWRKAYENNKNADTWEFMEQNPIQKAIKEMGYDGFYMKEKGHKNLAVFEPNQLKSAVGNEGTYNPKNPLMHKKEGGHIKTKVYLAKNVDQMKYELMRSAK